jgi:lipopolysaccharide transport system permease protein
MWRLGFDKADLRFMLSVWRMNLADRYLGSALGGAWAILNPLLMFALFAFVFGFVFKARMPGADSTLGYAIWLICGYGPWLANAEAMTAAANSIISNAGLVKNMAFKTEILPISATLLGLIPLAVSLVFLLTLQLLTGEGWGWSILWLPLIVLIQFGFLSAVGLVLAAITTFVRDFGIVLPNLLMILLFATPIFYAAEALPPLVAKVTAFNPIYILSDAYRASLLRHETPPLVPLFGVALCALGMLILGLGVFRRVKGYFPSII